MFLCKLNTSAHPQGLGLHLKVGLQLARGEIPHREHRVFVILSHRATDGEMTERDSVKEKE